MEVRHLTFADIPSVTYRGDQRSPTLQGYASVFYDGTEDSQFRLGENLVERIIPGAFDAALERGDDVRALFNHDPNLVLGRTPKTLSLSVDKKGLRYEIDAGTTLGRQVAESVSRGDITGSSFGFIVDEDTIAKDGKENVREIRKVTLIDVSPVTFPAYESTSAETRAAILARVNTVLSKQFNADIREVVERLEQIKQELRK